MSNPNPNPNLMYFRFTHSMYCVFTYLFTQWDEYGYMDYVEYLPQYIYEYHDNHHFIIARLCSSSFLFSTPKNPSLTANSSGLPWNSPNEFSFFRMNVFLLWRMSNWYGKGGYWVWFVLIECSAIVLMCGIELRLEFVELLTIAVYHREFCLPAWYSSHSFSQYLQ